LILKKLIENKIKGISTINLIKSLKDNGEEEIYEELLILQENSEV